ncbi:ABC transporter permease [Cumulibacter manganitolerans]|uniref:ABC transporter permease n=1 Tax=Cumulibacter manganitolerans TaxID=1884992 RepID=UPI0012959BEC|nr:ABC transporter permease [Cumulibacter manganitolerans]
MLQLITRRLAATIPLLIVVSFLIFCLILLTGDPATQLAGQNPTQEKIDQVREQLGLNDPFFHRYWDWLSSAFQGDFGKSLFTHESVMSSIMSRLPVTLSLVVVSLLIAILLGVALGLVAGLHPGTWIDRAATVTASIGVAIPYFWVGMMLVLAFAIDPQILPAVGYVNLTDDPVQWFLHLVLPALSLSIAPMAVIARQTRASVATVMNEDYIRTANAKGLARTRVIAKHALKNAAVPVVTVFGLEANRLIGGTVVIENLFVLPGLGQLAYQSVFQRDFPMVQGVLLFTAIMVLLINLLVDISYGYFNPRIRQS